MPPRKGEDDDSAGLLVTDSNAPAEEFNLTVYGIMMLLGLGLLIPWNVVVNSSGYFTTTLGYNNMIFYLTLAYTYPGLPVLVGIVRYGRHLSLKWRILGSLMIQVVTMALMPLVAPLSFWAPMALMFINGLCTNVLQSSLFGMASMFPPIFSQACMSGQGWAGIAASTLNIAFTAALADAPRTCAYVYFACAAAVMASCCVGYLSLLRHPFAIAYIRRAEAATAGSSSKDSGETSPLAPASLEAEDATLLAPSAGGSGEVSLRSVLSRMWPMALSVHLVFLFTFIAFPGLVANVSYQGSPAKLPGVTASNGWWAILLFACFNVFDTVGRTLPAKLILVGPTRLLPVVACRIVFIPLFMACAYQYSWLKGAFNDGAAMVIMALFSGTNGYLASLAFMFSPGMVQPHERETAGFVMSLCLNLGIALGSSIALAFTGSSG